MFNIPLFLIKVNASILDVYLEPCRTSTMEQISQK